MTNQTKPEHGSFERSDIGVSGVLYFLLGLVVLGVITHFVITAFYSILEKRTEAQQTPVSALVNNAPADTRHLPPEYATDEHSRDYQKYLEKNFPAPQLETDERTQLNKIRVSEEQTLSSYDYLDQKAGTVRIPIDRAMDLIAQRGLPFREMNCGAPNIVCITNTALERAHSENKNGEMKNGEKRKGEERKGENKKGNKP